MLNLVDPKTAAEHDNLRKANAMQMLINFMILQEKDQQKRLKEKAPKNGIHGGKTGIGATTVGNNHTASQYFNHGLDDIIQGLNHMIPLFVEKCVQYIETNGLSTEGLYRIPANAKERENILRKFDEDNNIDLSTLSVTVQTVAGCLTWFFSHKNLPEPLIPHNLHEELEEAINMPDPSLRNLSVRGVIRKLPHSHYATFKFLCKHLNNVCQHEGENKMNSENISICWWPTLFRPELNDMKQVAFGRPCLKDVLLTCVVQCGFIFYNQPEV